MCQRHTGRALLGKELAPEVRQVVESFFRAFSGALDPIRRDIVEVIQDGEIDPSSLSSIELEVEERIGNYTTDIQTVYREGTEEGVKAGRALAARRDRLDISVDISPQSTLREFANWSEEIVEREVMKTLTEETIQFVRSAHEEGLSIPDITQAVNDGLFERRLQDHVAERNARTAVISSSNAGQHSAFVDADSVVGTQWLATTDSRTREAHVAADGQIVSLDGSFLIGGVEARYPGDPLLPVQELVQCRCTTYAIFRDDLSESEFATIQAGGRIWR